MPKNNLKSDVRRGLLKSLAAGGVSGAVATFPESWTKPVVSSVMLPGHADTTCDEVSMRTELILPGTTINVCDDVFARSQQELYTVYSLEHACGKLVVNSSYESFGTQELEPDPLAVDPNQVMIYRKRRRIDSPAPAQLAVFTTLGASNVVSIDCGDSLGELIAGTFSEDEVPLDVDGRSYSVKVTIKGNADPLQLILADLLVR